jgi:hypothetical protein
MVRRDGDSGSDKTASSEALVAYHTVLRGQVFVQKTACQH